MVHKADIKMMELEEFEDKGFLRELNRLFLHPLGLHMDFKKSDNNQRVKEVCIWNGIHDPEGMMFTFVDRHKLDHFQQQANDIAALRLSKAAARKAVLGDEIQPYAPTVKK